MKISVTADHIELGERLSCGRCPVALAIRGRADPLWSVLVQGNAFTFVYRGLRDAIITVFIPDAVMSFIERFDHEKPVEPFEFDLFEPWGIFG